MAIRRRSLRAEASPEIPIGCRRLRNSRPCATTPGLATDWQKPWTCAASLAATCRAHCARVFHVQTADDLRVEWFRGAGVVGLTAGTSTPDDVIDLVESRLRVLAKGQLAA